MAEIQIAGGPGRSLAVYPVAGLPIGTILTDVNGLSWQLSKSVAAVDGTTVETAFGASNLRWLLHLANADVAKLFAMYRPKPGVNLTNADATIQPVTDKASIYVLPATVPLTVNRSLTLGVTSVFAGMEVWIVRVGAGAFTLAVINGGGGAGTKHTFPASPTEIQAARFVSDGTNWSLGGVEYMTVT